MNAESSDPIDLGCIFAGGNMARTLVIGLTESGKQTTVNEDTFSLGGRVYPDMITGSEEQSGNSDRYNQLYLVTQGEGGPGAGDLAGRIVQRTAGDLTELLGRYQSPDLNFDKFSRDLVREAHTRVLNQIKPRGSEPAGTSLALLLIDANAAYLLNIGKTDIFLFRKRELFHLSCPPSGSNDRADILIGDQRAAMPPATMTTRKVDLQPGDVLLLTSEGFRRGYKPRDLIDDLGSPDAFAASIRQAQIHSRQADDTMSGTILAVKVRDLGLSEPVGETPDSQNRKTIYYDGREETADMNQAPARKSRAATKGGDDMARQKKEKRGRKVKTFFLFVLLGFLIGLAAILFVWFLILK